MVTEAVERCGTSTNYYSAVKAVRESGDFTLYCAVLRGDKPVLASARRVQNAAVAIAAYQKCSLLERELVRLATGVTTDLERLLRSSTPEQLVEVSRRIGLDWVWDNMINAAMPTEPATGVKAKLNETAVPLL